MTKRGKGIDVCNAKAPCKDCKNRFVGCHSQCELYQEYRAKNEKRYADHLNDKKLMDDFLSLRNTSYCRNVSPKDRKSYCSLWT